VLYLLLKVTSAVGMGLVLKRCDARSLARLPLIRTNYAVAAVIGFFASVALNQTHISNQTALLAAVTGVLFVAGLLIWARAIQAAGLTRSVVAMRTAVVIPVFAAALIWHEQPSLLEIAGSFVALLALALVLFDVATRETPVGDETTAKTKPESTTKTPRHQERPDDSTAETQSQQGSEHSISRSLDPAIPSESLESAESVDARSLETAKDQPTSALIAHRSSLNTSSALLWLLLLFLADGLVMIPALVFRKEMPLDETMPFQTIIFVAAFAVTSVLYYLRRPRLDTETLKWGALLGTANFGNYLFLVLALTALPGLVVYPVIAAGEVGLLAIAGVVLWKEKVGVRSWLGIALAIAAIVLIQLGKSAA
jgi:drug/metabolite transporter (DMT)-like permease